MINTATLETLLSLHNENQQKSEKILADIVQKKNCAETKLSELLLSREHFQKNFEEQSKQGINSFSYNQYMLFIQNLDKIINDQYKIITQIGHENSVAKAKWIESKKQVLIYNNIKTKQNVVQNNIVLKKEQNQQDEWCLRQYYEKNKDK